MEQVNKIERFEGDYAFLSNFYRAPVTYCYLEFPTLEHAFQAAKCADTSQMVDFVRVTAAGDAKRLGRRVRLRDDWEQIKVSVMHGLLEQKFSDAELCSRLLATGTAELIEGNDWGDTFWGRVAGRGRNMLGELLMQVRNDKRKHLEEFLAKEGARGADT